MITYIGNIIKKWLVSHNISEDIANEITDFAGLIFVFLLAWISFYIAKRIIIHIVHLLVKKSKNKWDDVFAEKNVFNRLAYLAPAIVIHLLTPLVIPKYEFAITVIDIITKIYMIFTVLVVLNSFLNAFNNILTDNLDFIRNSGGSVLRKIGPNWVNGLGDVHSGEGYLIKMFSDDILIYNIPENTKSFSYEKPLPVHFSFDGGNPADPVYTLYISGLEIGDEVAAYDRDKIIGAAKISSNYVFDNELPVFSTLTDSKGYVEGNPIILKVWNPVSKDVESVKIAMENNYNSYEGNVYPTGDGQFSIVNITKSTTEEKLITIYPNPAENVINISSSNQINNVTIYNYVGQTVYNGNSIQINTSNFDAGVYIIRIETNDGSTTEKLTIK